jgi:hypothetical protein
MFYRLLLLLVVLSAYTGHAQLRVQLLGERSTFLLYEPIVYNLVLANEGGTEVVLRDSADGLRPWLSFLIFNSAGEKIRRVQGKGCRKWSCSRESPRPLP